MDISTLIFGSENVNLDDFQCTLLRMTQSASQKALAQFFALNYQPLYAFLLQLYLSSLNANHPARKRDPSRQSSNYTTAELKIIAQWSHLLTPETDARILYRQQKVKQQKIQNINIDEAIKDSSTSNDPPPIAKVSKKKKKTNEPEKVHSQKSFSGFANFAAIVGTMKYTTNNRGIVQYPNNQKKISHDDSKNNNHPKYEKSRALSRRCESIWDGVLDINNIIMVPETPKWRANFSFQDNALLSQALLECIINTLTPSYSSSSLSKFTLPTIADETMVTSLEAVCIYLPILSIISTKLSSPKLQQELQLAIVQRAAKEDDVKQMLSFFLHSYKDCPSIIKALRIANLRSMKEHKYSVDESTMNSRTFSSASSNYNTIESSVSNVSIVSNVSNVSSIESNVVSGKNKPQIIQQTNGESCIALFDTVFRKQLSAGSQIHLALDSKVRDPVNYGAPPLSRLDIRKIIPSNSKPYLIDCYVKNRRENFEYLSSTIILKKGDDLRRDAAVLHVFRLMNKVWKESGLDFNSVPVHVLTYKCVPMSPNYGALELIPGCKPLRVIMVLEDTITIGQQFNLVASAAGSYIAAFVMGVRDRHFDNVLVRDSDCTLFHIDFGFVLGETASVDTSKFAITNDLKKLMGMFWDDFVQLCVVAYLALRRKHKHLIKFARLAFENLFRGNEVEEFLRAQLHLDDMSDDIASKYIARKVKESPDSVRTKLKNVLHQMATAKKNRK